MVPRVFPVACCFLLGGCFGLPRAQQGDLHLFAQIEDGAALLCEMPLDPEALEIAQVLQLNAQQLGSNFGKPAGQTQPYSAAASGIYRAQSAQEHAASRAFWGAIGAAAGVLSSFLPTDPLKQLLGGGGAITVLLGLWRSVRKEQKAHQATSDTLAEMAEEHPEPEQAGKLLSKLKKAHTREGVAHIGTRVYSNTGQKG